MFVLAFDCRVRTWATSYGDHHKYWGPTYPLALETNWVKSSDLLRKAVDNGFFSKYKWRGSCGSIYCLFGWPSVTIHPLKSIVYHMEFISNFVPVWLIRLSLRHGSLRNRSVTPRPEFHLNVESDGRLGSLILRHTFAHKASTFLFSNSRANIDFVGQNVGYPACLLGRYWFFIYFMICNRG